MTVINLKIILKIILFLPLCIPAQHKIQSYVIGGGATSSSSSSSKIKGTIGQPLTGSSGNKINSGFWIQLNEITTDLKEIQSGTVPTEYNLYQNYPNPFNPSTIIKYNVATDLRYESLPTGRQDQDVRLIVYDILGRIVATLVNEKQRPGNYEVMFDANKLTSGIYFYNLKTGDYVETRKMLLMK